MKTCIEDDDFDPSFGENMEDSEDSDSDSDSDDMQSDKEHGPSDNNNEEESLLLLIKEIANCFLTCYHNLPLWETPLTALHDA
jgi:hypothetical protein